jgi:microcystin-dependent protein
MAEPFVAEIRAFGFTFAPSGWFSCQGQLLPISQYTALFSLVGTFYGGNGTSTFGLPDLRGRVAIHQGDGFDVGESGGTENAVILLNNMPNHSHTLVANDVAATAQDPSNALLAAPARNGPAMYEVGTAPNVPMAAASIGSAGSNAGFSTRQPTLVLNYCIAFEGVFPARN